MSTKKIIHIMVLCSAVLLFLTSPALRHINAGTLKWTIVDTPDTRNNVIVSPSELDFLNIAPDGRTIYSTDIPNSKVYRSKDGGYSWTDISSYLVSAGAILPAWNLAVAPDNPDIIAAVTSAGGVPRHIFLSLDSGNNWQNLGFPGVADICALDISEFYGSYDIAAGTRTTTGAGRIFVFKTSSGIGSWADQGFAADILAIRFSPNYSSDNSIIFASADSSGTYINIGVRDTTANTTHFGSWPTLEITASGSGTSPKANQIQTADIELPADFLGQSGASRRIFVSTCDSGISGNTGIFRVDDTLIYHIFQASGARMISSISYIGTASSGKLLAGEVKASAASASVDVWYCPNATADCLPATCLFWQKASKPPTGGANSGNANAQVAWSSNGNMAFCVTSSADLTGSGWPGGYLSAQALDESAFSYSMDNGNTWNQISLIDTQISFLSDYLPAFDAETLYLGSINTVGGYNGFDSVWRTSDLQPVSWERVLCILASSNDTILRMDANSPQEIFLGIRNTHNLLWSPDRGQTWKMLSPNVNLTDFCVTQINSLPRIFVLSGSSLRSGEYAGASWKWGQPVSTGLASGHMLAAAPNGIVLAGGDQGEVAVSLDAGASFNELPALPAGGNAQVILDTRVRDPYLIHAATDNPLSEIYSWILGSSTNWINMNPPQEGYYGLAQLNTFYACHSGAGSSVSRTLQPELSPPLIEWSTMEAGLDAGVVFTRQPSALKISAGTNLWAIDNRPYTAATGRLWQYCDCLSGGDTEVLNLPAKEILLAAPLPLSPANNTTVQIDTSTAEMPSVKFSWQHATPAAGYDLIIASDTDFKQVILEKSIRPESVNSPVWVLPAENSPLQPGVDYYWKVRINRIAYTYEQVQGQWSDTIHFSIMSIPPATYLANVISLVFPADGAVITDTSPDFSWTTDATINEYEFIVSRDSAMQQIVQQAKTAGKIYHFSGTLKPSATYYWQVRPVEPGLVQPSGVFRFSVAGSGDNVSAKSQVIPLWLWILVAMLAIITTVVLVLVFTANRRKAGD